MCTLCLPAYLAYAKKKKKPKPEITLDACESALKIYRISL